MSDKAKLIDKGKNEYSINKHIDSDTTNCMVRIHMMLS